MRFFGTVGGKEYLSENVSSHRRTDAEICSGVEPQHPPTIQHPSFTSSSSSAANSSGITSKVVTPFTTLGRPALGCTRIGMEQTFVITGRNFKNCLGPNPQFIPSASTPRPSARAT